MSPQKPKPPQNNLVLDDRAKTEQPTVRRFKKKEKRIHFLGRRFSEKKNESAFWAVGSSFFCVFPFPTRIFSNMVLVFITPPEVANTGTRFLTGGPGAAPGGVASKNGWVYMRVQRGVISYSRESLSVCLLSVVTKQPLVSKMACSKGCAFAEAGRGINSAA